MHLVTHGADTATPVLALHGWPVDHRLMSGCLEPLFTRRPGYRRLYPDLPGMGRTPAGAAASSDDLLAAVLTLIEAVLGTTPFLLVGESYGGYLSRAVTRALPHQVLGLALICPVGQTLDRDARIRPPHQVLRTTPGLLDDLDDATRAEFVDLAVVQTPATLRRFNDEVVPALALADRDAITRIERRWHLTEAPDGPTPFDRPTLILCGRQDSSVGYADQFALLPHYPRATFAVLDVAGHNLQIEQPALFETLMNDWLDRCTHTST
ncbi:alpha/beta hydrolase [Dactylosporangium sp. NBC_01737]|uniref:alpha/beta fold hydrolase n=1 Tax=Dactylosporangium sp. NBC_01737 TaxID=2975959 RepID=UPI002E0E4882|nr:alpha/beta hydrolase [Dactylosporangium sp. NBC_01737]